ncbi:hypothetical protein BDW68DRAFT_186313 [Aspergillus falconensis]
MLPFHSTGISFRLCSRTAREDSSMADQTAVNNALGTILARSRKWPFSCRWGGPLHRAALTAFDHILHNDLLKGKHIGHMLGSPFYADSGLKYTVYDSHGRREAEEYVRNDLWSRAVAHYPIPSSALATRPTTYTESSHAQPTTGRIRAFHKVSYLKLSAVHGAFQPRVVAGDENGAATLRVYAALVVTELIGVVIGTVVLAKWRSFFGLLWFVPLVLKLISAAFAMQREPLKIPEAARAPANCSTSEKTRAQADTKTQTQMLEKPELPHTSSASSFSSLSSSETLSPSSPTPAPTTKSKIFEIHNEKHGFLLIEGPEDLVVQFFRHYGHPLRNRYRESMQLLMIICMGFVFPVGLVCCLVWMPISLQYLWLTYQLYTTLAMHIYRFTGGKMWATTEEQLLRQFVGAGGRGEPQVAYLQGFGGWCVKAELDVTFHGRFAEGKEHLKRLLEAKAKSDSETECC